MILTNVKIYTKQPPPVIILPIFWCLPDLVNGIPVFLEICLFKFDIPVALFHEKLKPYFFLLAN